jgi:hypothetical protein
MIEAPFELTATPPAAGPLPVHRAAEPFSHVLRRATRDGDRAVAREAAAKLVSSTFIMPVLEALRDSPFLEPPFAPTVVEKRFQPLLDQRIADRITTAANFPLVDVIVDRLLGPAPADDQAGASP